LDFCVENGAFWCTLSAIYTDCSNLKLYGLLRCTSPGRTSLIAVVNCGVKMRPLLHFWRCSPAGIAVFPAGVEPPQPPTANRALVVREQRVLFLNDFGEDLLTKMLLPWKDPLSEERPLRAIRRRSSYAISGGTTPLSFLCSVRQTKSPGCCLFLSLSGIQRLPTLHYKHKQYVTATDKRTRNHVAKRSMEPNQPSSSAMCATAEARI